jgi:hypothetical protein
MRSTALKESSTLVCALVILGAFAALPAVSQPPAASGPPAPSPEVGQLSYFVGDWSCQGKADASPMGPAHSTRATVHISKEMGGFWIVGRYAEVKSATNPNPMIFHFVQGYDGTAKSLVMDCFDGFGDHCHQTSAGWKDGKLVYSGEQTGSSPATQVRDTFTKKGEAVLEHGGEMQVDGKWISLDHETCVRAKN